MYDEKTGRGENERLTAARVYTLLYRLSADVRRLETLVRALKKALEERENT